LNKETRILLKVLRKPWKASFITAGFPHEIWSDNLPNRNQTWYHLSQLLQFVISWMWADDVLAYSNKVQSECTFCSILNDVGLRVNVTDAQLLVRNACNRWLNFRGFWHSYVAIDTTDTLDVFHPHFWDIGSFSIFRCKGERENLLWCALKERLCESLDIQYLRHQSWVFKEQCSAVA
jgi:hypothetical protein